MQQRSTFYTIAFAAGVCLVCSILVASAAVSLRPAQETNRALDKQRNVLVAAGLASEDEKLTPEEIESRFATFKPLVVNLETDSAEPEVDPFSIDPRKMVSDPRNSHEVPHNNAQLKRVADKEVIYQLVDEDGQVRMVVLPIHGKGLWSTLYGFIALSGDLQRVEGLTFYEHKETPGLGGEVDNPRWKSLWPGRKVFSPEGEVEIRVIKGNAGPPAEDPYEVDGLSGATITSRGVTAMLEFWLGDEGFGPYLETYRQRSSS